MYPCLFFILFRYRGSTDDLRRSREDISVPSLIPKLLSSRSKEERLKRQDSKDDIRYPSKSARKDSKEDAKTSSLVASPFTSKDDVKASGIRIFRRDNSREDVGRESANSIGSTKGKQQDKTQERTEDRGVGGATRSRAPGEQNRSRCEDGKDAINEESSSRCDESVVPSERDEATREDKEEEIVTQADVEDVQDAGMIDVIVAEDRTQDERREQDTMIVGEVIDEKHLLAREPVESAENDKQDDEETGDTAERLLDSSDGDVTGITGERRSLLEIGYGKRLDEFQVVSEYGRSWA